MQYHTKVITIIKTTGHESSSKQFCTIQIKVRTNTPQTPHMVKAWAIDCRSMWAEDTIFIKYYTEIKSRFSMVSFDTEKLNWKHREVFAPLSFVPDKEEFSLIRVQFQLIGRQNWSPETTVDRAGQRGHWVVKCLKAIDYVVSCKARTSDLWMSEEVPAGL